MKKHKRVFSYNREIFEKEVSEHLKKGWQLEGVKKHIHEPLGNPKYAEEDGMVFYHKADMLFKNKALE